MKPEKVVNVHVFGGVFKNATRVLKETNSIVLNTHVDEVVIYSMWEKGLLENEKLPNGVHIKRLKIFFKRFSKSTIISMLSYLEFSIKCLFGIPKIKPNYINAHSLNVFLLSIWMGKITKAKIIYDPHELETERESLKGKLKPLARKLESRLIQHASKIIVVCEPIREWYIKEYNLPKHKIFNIPNFPSYSGLKEVKNNIFREKFEIPENELIFIYQGILSKGRGINSLLEVFSSHSQFHIVFMGFGNLSETIKIYSKKLSNIHFQSAVEPKDIVKYTSSADVGIFFIEGDLGLSYTYSLPNKFGEYFQAGLPVVIGSNLILQSKIVQENQIGWVIDPTAKEFSEFLDENDFSTDEEMLNRIKEYSRINTWESSNNIFKNIYSV